MSDLTQLESNFARWLDGASLRDLLLVLRALERELELRDSPSAVALIESARRTLPMKQAKRPAATPPTGPVTTVEIQVCPHLSQRYDTVGDWWRAPDGTLQIRASEFPGPDGWKLSMCVAIHEFTEAVLCGARGIPEQAVDAFDTGLGATLDDPGDDPRAPYHREHLAARVPEAVWLSEFGISDTAFDAAMTQLPTWKANLSHAPPPGRKLNEH